MFSKQTIDDEGREGTRERERLINQRIYIFLYCSHIVYKIIKTKKNNFFREEIAESSFKVH